MLESDYCRIERLSLEQRQSQLVVIRLESDYCRIESEDVRRLSEGREQS